MDCKPIINELLDDPEIRWNFEIVLNYLITLLFFLIFGLYLKFVIQAQWTEGSSSDVITELFNYFKGIVFSGLVGSLGGFIGEKFRK